MEDLTCRNIINVVLSKYSTINKDDWFSQSEFYKNSLVREIYTTANNEKKDTEPTEKENSLIRAVINFIINLHPPNLSAPCSFISGTNFDLPTCKLYKEMEGRSSQKIGICTRPLTLQSRIDECYFFKENFIKETEKHAHAYIGLFNKII